MSDPLYVCNPRAICPVCRDLRRRRRNCEPCKRTGFQRIDLQGIWGPRPGFLICGGPSLQQVPLHRLKQRGVMTLGINNAAAFANCNAMVFGDPQWKFHSSLFFDPNCMVFAPNGKLCRSVRMQNSKTGEYYFSNKKLRDCPNTWGLCRSGTINPKTFFKDWFAHWGMGGHKTDREFTRLATMLLGIRLLHYLGCRRIYMLGVDFYMTKEDPYAWGGNRTSGNKIWWKIDNMLSSLKRSMRRAGVTVYNCNPDTQSKAFGFRSLDDALADATEPFGKPPYDLAHWYERGTMVEQRDLHPELVEKYVT